ncbi:MAG: hypothetical protein HGB11_01965 [Chlorobiales bacterium]|nr:hypothetical protein [Chlorobiales bacterium]
MSKLAAVFVLILAGTFSSYCNAQGGHHLFNNPSADSLLVASEKRKAVDSLAGDATAQIKAGHTKKMSQWGEFRQSLYQDKEMLDSAQRRRFTEKETALTDSLNSVSAHFQHALNQRLAASLHEYSDETVTRFQAYCLNTVDKHEKALSQTMQTFQDSLYTFAVTLHVQQLESQMVDADKRFSLSDKFAGMFGPRVKPSPQWSFSTCYSTRTVWQGLDQNDEKGSYSITAGYSHPIGISASISLTGLVGQEIVFDQTTLALAYQIELFDRFSVTAGYSHYIYNNDSPQLTSSITDDVSLLAIYDNPILTPQASLTYAFAADNDIFASLQVSHSFWISNVFGGVMLIEPAISANFGTLESVSREFEIKLKRMAGEPSSRVMISSSSSSSSAFLITNYDVILPFSITFGSLTLAPELICTIPVNTERVTNSLNLVRDNGVKKISKTLTPDEDPLFYFSISVSLSF